MSNQQSQAFKPKIYYSMDNPKSQTSQANEQSSSGGLGGIGDKLSSAVGRGTEGSGDSQSLLDKGKKWKLLAHIFLHANDYPIDRYKLSTAVYHWTKQSDQ